jgi:6-phosphogluconate dehydrogenase
MMPVSLSPSLFSSVFLGKIKEAFDRDAELQNLLLDTFFSNAVQDCQVQ